MYKITTLPSLFSAFNLIKNLQMVNSLQLFMSALNGGIFITMVEGHRYKKL